eukprot:TRINITY_DN10570_c0_g1_i1.p1 TRINITY_DN10570_c0_g1~~TRINITY_DN10570_c0_g1_i1.p1  ORF type:complete len:159 (-),score=35.42 TRINITY_DN10570_c0_g1_i1:133-609(-)
MADPFDLRRRFVHQHKIHFSTALAEIQGGQKRSCWSWFIFPVAPWVVNGEERGSATNMQYCLRDLPPNNLSGDDAAAAYLGFKDDEVSLRQNYVDIMNAVADQVEGGVPIVRLVGGLDDPKLRSSLRLFERVSRNGVDNEVNEVCLRVLKAIDEPCDD